MPLSVSAHELFIAPTSYGVEEPATILADIKIGQEFSGVRFPYQSRSFTRFEIINGNQTAPVTGRMGDFPALAMPTLGAGLTVILYATTPDTITYHDPEKFVAFVTHKNFPSVLKAHKARGLPEKHFTETYRRFAKSLIAVGHGKGSDHAFGLETEIIALRNPYTAPLKEGLPFQVLYKGLPRIDAQIEVFAKARDQTVKITTYQTGADGKVVVPMLEDTEYLIDAVVMRPLGGDGQDGSPVWESLWASMTFMTPAQ